MEGEETFFFFIQTKKPLMFFRSIKFKSIRFKSIRFKSIVFKSIGFESIRFYPCIWTSWKAVLSNLRSRNTFSMDMEPFSLLNYMEKQKNPWSIQSLKIFFSVSRKCSLTSTLGIENWLSCDGGRGNFFFLDTDQKAFDVFRSIRFRSIRFKSIRFKSIRFNINVI